MTTQTFIQTEMKRRTDLVESVEFRTKCADIAQKMGITAEEWNNNKVAILMYFANEFCKIENAA